MPRCAGAAAAGGPSGCGPGPLPPARPWRLARPGAPAPGSSAGSAEACLPAGAPGRHCRFHGKIPLQQRAWALSFRSPRAAGAWVPAPGGVLSRLGYLLCCPPRGAGFRCCSAGALWEMGPGLQLPSPACEEILVSAAGSRSGSGMGRHGAPDVQRAAAGGLGGPQREGGAQPCAVKAWPPEEALRAHELGNYSFLG